MKDKLLELFKGHVIDLEHDSFWVDVEDTSGNRSHINIWNNSIPYEHRDRIFIGNYFNFIITKKRHKMNLGRIRYWTTDLQGYERNGTFLIKTEDGIDECNDILPTYDRINAAIGELF